MSYWGDGASGDNGFIHGADARQKGSFTSVLVHRCNIYIGKGNYAVRHRGKKPTYKLRKISETYSNENDLLLDPCVMVKMMVKIMVRVRVWLRVGIRI